MSTISVLIHSAAHNSEYTRVKHTQSGYRLKVFAFKSINRIRVDGQKRCENEAKTLRVDANFLKPEKKNCVLKRIWIQVDGA